jgi:hypothetical protein
LSQQVASSSRLCSPTTGISSVVFHSGFRVLLMVGVASFASPSDTTRYCTAAVSSSPGETPARQSCVCTWPCWRGGYSLGLKCHFCPLQPDSCPASVSGCSFSSAGHWNTHLDHVRPQHQARLNVAHGSFGAALSTRGDAVDRGAAAVVL